MDRPEIPMYRKVMLLHPIMHHPAWNTPDAQPEIGVFQARLENPDLKWETTTEMNVGLDVAILKNKISGSFEYYQRIISDLLYYKPLNTYHDLSYVIPISEKPKVRALRLPLI